LQKYGEIMLGQLAEIPYLIPHIFAPQQSARSNLKNYFRRWKNENPFAKTMGI
jgi:hypothetical protein